MLDRLYVYVVKQMITKVVKMCPLIEGHMGKVCESLDHPTYISRISLRYMALNNPQFKHLREMLIQSPVLRVTS